jgi:hypothetical protein
LPILRVAAFLIYLSLNAATSSFAGRRSIISVTIFLVLDADFERTVSEATGSEASGSEATEGLLLRLGNLFRFMTRCTIDGVRLSGLGIYLGLFGLTLGEFKKLSGFFRKTGTQSAFILRVNANLQYLYLLPFV